MKEKICGIYCIENLVNGKKYIGQSCDIYSRWSQHNRELNSNKHYNSRLQNAWNKYGKENFSFYIIEECDMDSLDKKEIEYISIENTFAYANKENSMGYNLTTGGNGQGEFTDKKRQKYRESQNSKPIYQITTDGEIIKQWKHGAREASKVLNIEQSCIWNCVNNKRRTYKGFIWIYVEKYDEFNLKEYVNVGTQPKKIKQYDMNGNYIKTWNCINDAIGFDCSAIVKTCNKKYKSHRGFLWCYENDDYITEEFIKEIHKKDYIYAYDAFGNVLFKTKTQQEMAKKFGISESLLSGILNEKVKNTTNILFMFSS